MSRPLWFVNLLKKNFYLRFRIATLSRKSGLVKLLFNQYLFKGDDVYYLPRNHAVQTSTKNYADQPIPIQIRETVSVGKDISFISSQIIEIHEPISQPENTILPSEVVEYFIHKAKYHWIMNECLCRSSNECKDYPIDLGCLFLGEAVLGINPQLGRLVSEQEALAHLRRSQEAGLFHIIGRNKIDSIWMGVQPADRLMTICNCCPCCCVYKMLPDLDASTSSKIHKMPGVHVTVTDQCRGCGKCTRENVCIVNAIHLVNGRAEINENCRGCGQCVEICPRGAIELTIDDPNFFDHTISKLSSLVNVS